MKRNLKIVLSWTMLALMAYNMIGYIFVFELADISNRDSMQRLLANAFDSQLQLLKVSDNSSVIRKGDHEIVFEGRHYDVKKEVTENGCTLIYCIHDNTEENIYTGLSDSVNANTDVQSGKQDVHSLSVLKNFVKDFFFQHSIEKAAVATMRQHTFNMNEPFSSAFFAFVITPPPQAIVA